MKKYKCYPFGLNKAVVKAVIICGYGNLIVYMTITCNMHVYRLFDERLSRIKYLNVCEYLENPRDSNMIGSIDVVKLSPIVGPRVVYV